jgi:hypothetical protein
MPEPEPPETPHPHDIDLDACTVRVTRQINYPPGGGHSFGPPKSRAGRRSVPFPDLIVPDLCAYLDGLGHAAALVSTSPDGQPLRHSNFYRRVWMPAAAATGMADTHLHDYADVGITTTCGIPETSSLQMRVRIPVS